MSRENSTSRERSPRSAGPAATRLVPRPCLSCRSTLEACRRLRDESRGDLLARSGGSPSPRQPRGRAPQPRCSATRPSQLKPQRDHGQCGSGTGKDGLERRRGCPARPPRQAPCRSAPTRSRPATGARTSSRRRRREHTTARRASGPTCGPAPDGAGRAPTPGPRRPRTRSPCRPPFRARPRARSSDRREGEYRAHERQRQDEDGEGGLPAAIHQHRSRKREETVRRKEPRRRKNPTFGLSEVSEQQDPDRDHAGAGKQRRYREQQDLLARDHDTRSSVH